MCVCVCVCVCVCARDSFKVCGRMVPESMRQNRKVPEGVRATVSKHAADSCAFRETDCSLGVQCGQNFGAPWRWRPTFRGREAACWLPSPSPLRTRPGSGAPRGGISDNERLGARGIAWPWDPQKGGGRVPDQCESCSLARPVRVLFSGCARARAKRIV